MLIISSLQGDTNHLCFNGSPNHLFTQLKFSREIVVNPRDFWRLGTEDHCYPGQTWCPESLWYCGVQTPLASQTSGLVPWGIIEWLNDRYMLTSVWCQWPLRCQGVCTRLYPICVLRLHTPCPIAQSIKCPVFTPYHNLVTRLEWLFCDSWLVTTKLSGITLGLNYPYYKSVFIQVWCIKGPYILGELSH